MNRVGGKWAATIPALFLLVGLALYLRGADLNSPPRWLPRCGFHYLTGLHCPGCGNTRATNALLHGDVARALSQNAIFVLGLPFLLFWACRSWLVWVYPERVRPLPFRWSQSYTLGIVALVVIFGVARNIPLPPFSWLAPATVTESRASSAPVGPPQDIPRQEGH